MKTKYLLGLVGVIVLQSCQYQINFPSFDSSSSETTSVENSESTSVQEKVLKSISVKDYQEAILSNVYEFELDHYQLELIYSDQSIELIPISYGMLSANDHLKLFGPGEHLLTLFYENLFTKIEVILTFDDITAQLFNYYSLYFAEANQGTSYLRFRDWRLTFIKSKENPIISIYLSKSGNLYVTFLDGSTTKVGKAFSLQNSLAGEFLLENKNLYWKSLINGQLTLLQTPSDNPALLSINAIEDLKFYILNKRFYFEISKLESPEPYFLIALDDLINFHSPLLVDVLSIDQVEKNEVEQVVKIVFDDNSSINLNLDLSLDPSLDLMSIDSEGYWVVDGQKTDKLARSPMDDFHLTIENNLIKVVKFGSKESQTLITMDSLNHEYDYLNLDDKGIYVNNNEFSKLLIDMKSFVGIDGKPNLRIENFELQFQHEDNWLTLTHLSEFLGNENYSRFNLRIHEKFFQIKPLETNVWFNFLPVSIFGGHSISGNEYLAVKGQYLGLISQNSDWIPIIPIYHFIQTDQAGNYFVADGALQWRGSLSNQVFSIIDFSSIFPFDTYSSINFFVDQGIQFTFPNDAIIHTFIPMELFNPQDLPLMIANGFIQLSYEERLQPIIELKSLVHNHENFNNERAIQYQLSDDYVQWRNLGQSIWNNIVHKEALFFTDEIIGYHQYLIENPSYFASFVQWKADVDANFVINPNAKFQVRFISDGVEVERYDDVISGSELELFTPLKPGHTFIGWFTSESVHASQFNDTSIVTNNLNLYARWSINRYKIEYFNNNELVHTDYYYFGERITLIPGLLKQGFAFAGWLADDGSTLTKAEMPAENLKFHASFVSYTQISSVEFMSANIASGSDFTFPDVTFATTAAGQYVQVPVIWDRKTVNLSIEGAYVFFGQVNGYEGLAIFRLHVTNLNEINNMLSGYVEGLESSDVATVILSNRSTAFYAVTDRWGYYEFRNLPYGNYKMKVEIQGYQIQAPRDISILNLTETQRIRLVRSPLFQIPQNAAIQHTLLEIERYELNHFFYEWQYGGDYFGYETSANIVPPTSIEFLNETIVVNDNAATLVLKDQFNVVLADGGLKWTVEYANRLLDMLKRAPVPQNHVLYSNLSKWTLVDYYLPKDIVYSITDGHYEVLISSAVFQNATPRLAEINGKKGIVFSNRLYHAVIRLLTNEGKDTQMVNHILTHRFGVSLYPNYAEITRHTTGEDATRFQPFESEELLHILNMFEEMPKGLHKIEGLKYLVRRLNGLSHPLYPNAAAVAWPFAGANYIEFMEVAFTTVSLHDTYRLILHEKAHFLWEFTIKDSLKNVWIELGGWYQTTDTASGWASTKTTEFVSAYAHAINPNEDMAESIASYLLNPNILKANALDKYYFIQNYVMSGTTYLAQIREDLTFEVFNLYPDYDYPGKINRVTINITGAPEEDKFATIEIELNHIDGLQDGANAAVMRIYSSFKSELGGASSTYFDLWLTPVNGNKHILKGYITLSKFLKSGYWKTDQIAVFDQNGGTRYEGAHQFGFKFYLDNPLEDIVKPKYVKDSANMTLENEIIDGRNFYRITVSFEADEVNLKQFNGAYARIAHENPNLYSFQSWGVCDVNTKICEATFLLSDFHPSGRYELREIFIVDMAENAIRVPFTKGESDEYVSLIVITLDEDSEKPEMDLNAITISAVPTNPSAPNGETRVTITYYARDDKSGLGLVYVRLLGPQGEGVGDYHYHANFYTLYFVGDPTAWTKYELVLILPAGSSPGLWGLAEMRLDDKAGNSINYNFLEILTFELLN